MTAPDSLLERDVRDGARLVALEYLDRLVAERAKLAAEPENADALHKSRVALRRLRATLRTFKPWLDRGVGRGGRKHLRALGRATSAARDADVQREWLNAEGEALPAPASDGARWLRARLDAERAAHASKVVAAFVEHLDPYAARWRRRLQRYQVPHTAGVAPQRVALATVISERLRTVQQEIRAALGDVRDVDSQEALHQLRIALKRLRALTVPFVGDVPELAPLYDHATRAQDALGAMRDAHLLARHSRRLARKHIDAGPALLDLATRLEAVQLGHYHSVAQRWLEDQGARELAGAHAAEAALRERGRGHHEIERKFLLRMLPPTVDTTRGVTIVQGWLPGERLRERLRRAVSHDGRVELTRTVKVGAGIVRVEVEEPTPSDLFESLWPLTNGARIEKVRHRVADGALTWELDVFLDRDLVLAEIELPHTDTPVVWPPWLAPYVEREVTDDPAYVNANLARVMMDSVAR